MFFQVLDNTLRNGQWYAGMVCKVANRKYWPLEEGIYSLDCVLRTGDSWYILLHFHVKVDIFL